MTDKTVADKARVKPGATVAVVDAVPGVVESLGLPADVRWAAPDAADIVLFFPADRAALERTMGDLVEHLAPKASLWVFFRKGSKAAGLDMNRDTVWALAESLDMRPLGLLSVDETFSVFRLRRANA